MLINIAFSITRIKRKTTRAHHITNSNTDTDVAVTYGEEQIYLARIFHYFHTDIKIDLFIQIREKEKEKKGIDFPLRYSNYTSNTVNNMLQSALLLKGDISMGLCP